MEWVSPMNCMQCGACDQSFVSAFSIGREDGAGLPLLFQSGAVATATRP